ncbi:MAG TPA: phosphatase PAP2 family protein [Rhizomicrobium sp.]|nr:phosphatase PAP2 family protein [Rhizomicrobium sp.]
MLLWTGIALILCGVGCFAIDRRATHLFHAAVARPFERVLHASTDWAKGALWLTVSVAALVIAFLLQRLFGHSRSIDTLAQVSLAFLVSLAAASLILHTIKTLLGRRRPRDELELDLYGFRPFTFDLRSDSFPSGHALTIFCVAVVVSAVTPGLALLWFAVAAYLALTRALLNSHFVSDVLVGAGIALVTTREVLVNFFPALARPWF